MTIPTVDKKTQPVPRPPVVTLMGHVDHGKTSILDWIRQTSLQAGEAGGITQSIGAYQVDIAPQLKDPAEFEQTKITFIDTPGHEAFTQMRARGSQVADLVVLVVARNDGVQPQTIEAIHHAQAAQTPLLVAINKMDLPGKPVSQIKKGLAQQGVLVEGFGGKIPCLEISAKDGKGIPQLLEIILLAAQLQELKADLNQPAEGVIIESRRNPKQGIQATLILQNGQLAVGDTILTTSTYARIKRLSDWQGQALTKLTPGLPAEALGFKELPQAGEQFIRVADEKRALEKLDQPVQASLAKDESLPKTIKDLIQSETQKKLNLILKADAVGSLDALHHSLEKLKSETLKLAFIHEGLGQISQSDILLAVSSRAVVLGFRVGITPAAKKTAQTERVIYRCYDTIYHLLDELSDVIEGKLAEGQLKILAQAEIVQVFELSDQSRIAGVKVLEGTLKRGQKAQIIHQQEVYGPARVISLRQSKEKVDSVKPGQECGVGLKPELQLSPGDIIQTYED